MMFHAGHVRVHLHDVRRAGTALYWFVSNVCGRSDSSTFTNWLIGPPAVHAVRPAAERRIKNAGTGRTAGAEKHS